MADKALTLEARQALSTINQGLITPLTASPTCTPPSLHSVSSIIVSAFDSPGPVGVDILFEF